MKKLIVSGWLIAFSLVVNMVSTGICNADETAENTPKTSLDAAKLIGEWSYTAGKRAGEDVTKERLQGTVTITKETFTLPAGPDSAFVMTYKINTTKTPAQIDLQIKSGPVSEGTTIGIIKLENGELTLCYDPEGKERPTEFSSTKDNGTFLFVLKKKAGEKKEDKK